MIRFRPEAAREFAADFRHYEKDHPGRGRRFVEAVDAVLGRIAEAPEQFPLLLDLGDHPKPATDDHLKTGH